MITSSIKGLGEFFPDDERGVHTLHITDDKDLVESETWCFSRDILPSIKIIEPLHRDSVKQKIISDLLVNLETEKALEAFKAINFGWVNEDTTKEEVEELVVRLITPIIDSVYNLSVADKKTQSGGVIVEVSREKEHADILYEVNFCLGGWDNHY